MTEEPLGLSLIPGCTGSLGSCVGHRHRAHSLGHWPASSGKGHTGHTWGPLHWADTSSVQFLPHKAYLSGHLRCCSHKLWEGGKAGETEKHLPSDLQERVTSGTLLHPSSAWPCRRTLCPRLSLGKQNSNLMLDRAGTSP